MKNQALFSSKDKSNKLECHLLQFSFGTLMVKKELSYTFSLSKKENYLRNILKIPPLLELC